VGFDQEFDRQQPPRGGNDEMRDVCRFMKWDLQCALSSVEMMKHHVVFQNADLGGKGDNLVIGNHEYAQEDFAV
jgi:hypothetical protein